MDLWKLRLQYALEIRIGLDGVEVRGWELHLEMIKVTPSGDSEEQT